MNFTILVIGAAVLVSLIAMIIFDIMDDHNDQQRSERQERQLDNLQQSFEARQKKNIVFLNLGEEH